MVRNGFFGSAILMVNMYVDSLIVNNCYSVWAFYDEKVFITKLWTSKKHFTNASDEFMIILKLFNNKSWLFFKLLRQKKKS